MKTPNKNKKDFSYWLGTFVLAYLLIATGLDIVNTVYNISITEIITNIKLHK